MATVHLGVPKKKSSHHAGHPTRDGLTGMSLETQRHFIKVRQKMTNYVDEQEALANNDGDLDVRSNTRKHHRHLNDLLDHIFVDGKKAPAQQSQSSTPMSLRTHRSHHGSAVPQPARRGRKTSFISVSK